MVPSEAFDGKCRELHLPPDRLFACFTNAGTSHPSSVATSCFAASTSLSSSTGSVKVPADVQVAHVQTVPLAHEGERLPAVERLRPHGEGVRVVSADVRAAGVQLVEDLLGQLLAVLVPAAVQAHEAWVARSSCGDPRPAGGSTVWTSAGCPAGGSTVWAGAGCPAGGLVVWWVGAPHEGLLGSRLRGWSSCAAWVARSSCGDPPACPRPTPRLRRREGSGDVPGCPRRTSAQPPSVAVTCPQARAEETSRRGATDRPPPTSPLGVLPSWPYGNRAMDRPPPTSLLGVLPGWPYGNRVAADPRRLARWESCRAGRRATARGPTPAGKPLEVLPSCPQGDPRVRVGPGENDTPGGQNWHSA